MGGGLSGNETTYHHAHLFENCYDTGAEYVAIIDKTLAIVGMFARASRPSMRPFYANGLLGWNGEDWPKGLFWLVDWINAGR